MSGRTAAIDRSRTDAPFCDRYLASSIAYGEAQGLDGEWLQQIQRFLPQLDITFLLDIAPEDSARRKTDDRDRYERDLALLAGVRASWLRQAESGWVRLDVDRDRNAVAVDVHAAVADPLARAWWPCPRPCSSS